jgi:Flp pilus assembly protein TadG
MTPPPILTTEQAIPLGAGKSKTAQFLSREGGATAVEFALVAAPFIALILAVLQIGLIYFAQEALETAVEQTSRLVLTGQAPSAGGAQSASQFAAALCKNSPGLFNCNGFMIDLQPATSFTNANVAPPLLTFNNGVVTNVWQYNPGAPGNVMVMRVMYQWPVFLGPLGFNLSNLPNNMLLLMAASVFRNENPNGNPT